MLAGNAALFRDNPETRISQMPAYEEFTPAEMDLALCRRCTVCRNLCRRPLLKPSRRANQKLPQPRWQQAGSAIRKIQSVEYSGAGTQALAAGRFAGPIETLSRLSESLSTGNESGFAGAGRKCTDGWLRRQVRMDQFAAGFAGYSACAIRVNLFAACCSRAAIGLLSSSAGLNRLGARAWGRAIFRDRKLTPSPSFPAAFTPSFISIRPRISSAGARYQQDTPQGAVETIEVWSDYREVDGAKFPCHGLTLRNGQKFAEYNVQEIKFNTNLDAALFAKPAAAK